MTPVIHGLKERLDRSDLAACPLCGEAKEPWVRAAKAALTPSRSIFIRAEAQVDFACSCDTCRGKDVENGPHVKPQLRPLCIYCIQRFPVCTLCIHWIGDRGWSSTTTSLGKCRKNSPPWPSVQSFQRCGEFVAILSHTFTLKQLEQLHKQGPGAIKALWFKEQSP